MKDLKKVVIFFLIISLNLYAGIPRYNAGTRLLYVDQFGFGYLVKVIKDSGGREILVKGNFTIDFKEIQKNVDAELLVNPQQLKEMQIEDLDGRRKKYKVGDYIFIDLGGGEYEARKITSLIDGGYYTLDGESNYLYKSKNHPIKHLSISKSTVGTLNVDDLVYMNPSKNTIIESRIEIFVSKNLVKFMGRRELYGLKMIVKKPKVVNLFSAELTSGVEVKVLDQVKYEKFKEGTIKRILSFNGKIFFEITDKYTEFRGVFRSGECIDKVIANDA